MVVWFDVLWWGYIVLWTVLLIHCLLKRTFFPIFGPGWGTKVFWLVTFLFMDPLLTALYLVFGVILSLRKPAGTCYPRAATVCLILTVVVIALFERPVSNEPGRETTIVRHGQEDPQNKGFQAQLGALQANCNISTVTSTVNAPHARFCAKSVVIQNRSDHLLIDKVCRIMQEKIAEFPYVQEVQYRPAGAPMSEPLGRRDVFVVVDARDISVREFGIKRTVGANVFCQIGTEPVEKNQHPHYGCSPPVVQFSMNCHLEHNSVFKGFETSGARYQQQSADIAKQFIEAMTKQFDTWIEKDGLLPELPDYLYTEDPNAVAPAFLAEKGATLFYQSGGLLIGSRALWTYEDDRSNLEAFREICDTLQGQGWQGGHDLDRDPKPDRTIQSFTMRRDNERLHVFRTSGRSDLGGMVYGDDEQLEKKLPIGVEYLSLLPAERITELLGRFFRSEADVDTKLIFEGLCPDENLKQLLVDSLESAKVKTMQGYLVVGQFYAGKEETAKATDALMMARVLSRADRQHNAASNEIEALAKKIGDESLATTELPVEYYARVGGIDLASVDLPVVFERRVGEPLMFYAILPEGSYGKVKTVAITITQTLGSEDQYQITTIEKTKGSSSVGTRDLASTFSFSNPLAGESLFQLNAEKLEGDTFKLTLRKG